MIEWVCQDCHTGNEGGMKCRDCGSPVPAYILEMRKFCRAYRAMNEAPSSPDLPARYHAALDEVEAKTKATQRAIRDLLHELEQSTGAEVKGIQLQRRWPEHKPSFVEFVTLNLEALPQGRRVHPAGR